MGGNHLALALPQSHSAPPPSKSAERSYNGWENGERGAARVLAVAAGRNACLLIGTSLAGMGAQVMGAAHAEDSHLVSWRLAVPAYQAEPDPGRDRQHCSIRPAGVLLGPANRRFTRCLSAEDRPHHRPERLAGTLGPCFPGRPLRTCRHLIAFSQPAMPHLFARSSREASRPEMLPGKLRLS